MTRTDILRIVAAAGWLLAIASIGAERRIVRRLSGPGAVDPRSAVPLPVRSPITRLRLARLRKYGAVVPVDADRFYFDAAGYATYRRARRRRALAVLTIALPLILALWWWSSSEQRAW